MPIKTDFITFIKRSKNNVSNISSSDPDTSHSAPDRCNAKNAQLSTPPEFGISVLDPLPTLPLSALLRLETHPFLPADLFHPFPKVYSRRPPRSHELHHIPTSAVLKTKFVAASCVLASRLAGSPTIQPRERPEQLRQLYLLSFHCWERFQHLN